MIGGISGIGSYGMGSVGAFYQSRLTENIRNMRGAQQTRQEPAITLQKKSNPEQPVQAVTPVRSITRGEASVPELAQQLENDAAAMAGRMRTQYGTVNEEGLFVESGKESGQLSPVLGSQENALEGQLAQVEDALTRNDPNAAADALDNGVPRAAMPGEEDEEEIPGMPQTEDEASELSGAEDSKSAQEVMEEGECETCENRKYQDGSDDMGVSFQTPTNIKPGQVASAVMGHEREHVYREQAKAEREGREVVRQTVTLHTEICPECGKSYISGGTTETVTKAAAENDVQQDASQKEKDDAQKNPFSAAA